MKPLPRVAPPELIDGWQHENRPIRLTYVETVATFGGVVNGKRWITRSVDRKIRGWFSTPCRPALGILAIGSALGSTGCTWFEAAPARTAAGVTRQRAAALCEPGEGWAPCLDRCEAQERGATDRPRGTR